MEGDWGQRMIGDNRAQFPAIADLTFVIPLQAMFAAMFAAGFAARVAARIAFKNVVRTPARIATRIAARIVARTAFFPTARK
jgi:hypothetical protein